MLDNISGTSDMFMNFKISYHKLMKKNTVHFLIKQLKLALASSKIIYYKELYFSVDAHYKIEDMFQ